MTHLATGQFDPFYLMTLDALKTELANHRAGLAKIEAQIKDARRILDRLEYQHAVQLGSIATIESFIAKSQPAPVAENPPDRTPDTCSPKQPAAE